MSLPSEVGQAGSALSNGCDDTDEWKLRRQIPIDRIEFLLVLFAPISAELYRYVGRLQLRVGWSVPCSVVLFIVLPPSHVYKDT